MSHAPILFPTVFLQSKLHLALVLTELGATQSCVNNLAHHRKAGLELQQIRGRCAYLVVVIKSAYIVKC